MHRAAVVLSTIIACHVLFCVALNNFADVIHATCKMRGFINPSDVSFHFVRYCKALLGMRNIIHRVEKSDLVNINITYSRKIDEN